jgi:hypothetical protein
LLARQRFWGGKKKRIIKRPGAVFRLEAAMIEKPAIVRLVPEAPLPPYSYVPKSGLPHPKSDPAGHSFDTRPAQPPKIDPDRWEDSRSYLYGFDLLNRQFFWEAHETWESLWHSHGRNGVVADLLKGLIKLAAAGVKHREGYPGGVTTHARRAAELWREVDRSLGQDSDLFLGLQIRGLIGLAADIAQHGWPQTPVILIPVLGLSQRERRSADSFSSGH